MGVWRAFMKEEFKWRKHVCKRNVKGSPKTKHWSNGCPEFWLRQEGWRSKQNNVIERNRSQQSPSLGDPRSGSNAIYGRRSLVCCEQKQAADRAETDRWMVWLSTDSRYSKAAETLCAYQKGILVQKKSSVIGGRRIFLTKMSYRRRQGYLPKLVTKMNEMPTTFESSVIK